MKKVLYLFLIPIGLFIGILVGEGIYSLLGYETGSTDAPIWVKAASAIPAYAIIIGFAWIAFQKWRKK